MPAATSPPRATSSSTPTVGHRPLTSRQQQIVEVASDAFAERGYHQVSLDQIAAVLGMSGPALYRHFRSKYALFVACAESHVDALLTAWPKAPLGVDLRAADAAGAEIQRVVAALLEVTLSRRRSGGMYRWQSHYLAAPDRAAIAARYQKLVERLALLVAAHRPGLGDREAQLVAVAVLSVVGSVTTHRTTSTGDLTALIAPIVARVLHADLPPADPAPAPALATASAAAPGRRPGGELGDELARRDRIIEGAIALFHDKGYGEVTIEEIAAAAGLAPSGLYRHFPGKADVLYAVCERAALRIEQAVEGAGIRGIPADDALGRLAASYVDHCFVNHEQVAVSYSSIGSLSEHDQTRLRELQREHVAVWTTLLTARDEELDQRAARFLVMAAVNVVTDVGRSVAWDPAHRRTVRALVSGIVG